MRCGAPHAVRTGGIRSYDPGVSSPGAQPPEPTQTGPLEEVIAAQVRELRRARNISLTELARRTGMSKGQLSKIENAQSSTSLTTIGRLADALSVPVTSLFRGVDDDREAVFTAPGEGARFVRPGELVGNLFQFRMLGSLRGENKTMEPILVTLTEPTEVFPLYQHSWTEFIYVLEGAMVYTHGKTQFEMRPGSSLIFDGEGPHGPAELLDLPVRFLSVTAYGHVR
jgi:transcriptional regulator with XRE-family HTH domain